MPEVKLTMMGDFGAMLKGREDNAEPYRTQAEIPVYVAAMMKSKGTSYGFPSVLRWVEVSYIDGPIKVSYRRYVSNTMEMDHMGPSHDPASLAAKHDAALDELEADVRKELEANNLDLPIIRGLIEVEDGEKET